MDFEKAISLIGTVTTDLRRVASALVVDQHRAVGDPAPSCLKLTRAEVVHALAQPRFQRSTHFRIVPPAIHTVTDSHFTHAVESGEG